MKKKIIYYGYGQLLSILGGSNSDEENLLIDKSFMHFDFTETNTYCIVRSR